MKETAVLNFLLLPLEDLQEILKFYAMHSLQNGVVILVRSGNMKYLSLK